MMMGLLSAVSAMDGPACAADGVKTRPAGIETGALPVDSGAANPWGARVQAGNVPVGKPSSWAATVTYLRPGAAVPVAMNGAFGTHPGGSSRETPQAEPITGRRHDLEGIASFYWQGQTTASGETFDRNGMTAAHRTLPMGTRVKVTNVVTGRSVVVRINDRGPFKRNRIIDLSEAAAKAIGMERMGLAPVKVEVVGRL